MNVKETSQFLMTLEDYCYFSESLFNTYKDDIEELIKRYLNATPSVKLYKKFNLKDKDPLDYIPTFDNEDRYFPLDMLFKEQFERAFGENLSMVRIHTGEYAHELASKHGAKAVTMGNDIHFARGMYSPYTDEGVALLAHEIQHVVQFNEKDRFFLYDEDIAVAEYMAETVEKQIAGMNLYSVSNTVFGDKKDVEKDNPEGTEKDVSSETDTDVSLDDFSNSNTETVYRLHIGTKIYEVSRKERDLIISRAADKLEEKLAGELSLSSSGRVDEVLMKFLNFIVSR